MIGFAPIVQVDGNTWLTVGRVNRPPPPGFAAAQMNLQPKVFAQPRPQPAGGGEESCQPDGALVTTQAECCNGRTELVTGSGYHCCAVAGPNCS
jgi:hypothetical protein